MYAPMISEHDWDNHPRRIITARDVIIKPDDPTDTAFYLLSGELKSSADADRIMPGATLSLIEFLACDSYMGTVTAVKKSVIIMLRRDEFRSLWQRHGKVLWPISCSLAADITKRGDLATAV